MLKVDNTRTQQFNTGIPKKINYLVCTEIAMPDQTCSKLATYSRNGSTFPCVEFHSPYNHALLSVTEMGMGAEF